MRVKGQKCGEFGERGKREEREGEIDLFRCCPLNLGKVYIPVSNRGGQIHMSQRAALCS